MCGLYIIYDCNYCYVGSWGVFILGDYNFWFLLLVDGVCYNDNVYDQVVIGSDFNIDVVLIEWVEFVFGFGFLVYGLNVFLGVINVIIKQGSDLVGLILVGELGLGCSVCGWVMGGGKNDLGIEWLFLVSCYL